MTVDPQLQLNIRAYHDQLQDLLEHHAGKFVLFSGGRLQEVKDTYESAINVAYAASDRVYMIQRVEPLRRAQDLPDAACRS